LTWRTWIAWRTIVWRITWNTWRSSENPISLEEDLEYHLKIAPADHLKTWKT
jgi:hypothetical protein